MWLFLLACSGSADDDSPPTTVGDDSGTDVSGTDDSGKPGTDDSGPTDTGTEPSSSLCTPLPAPKGTVVDVRPSQADELAAMVSSAEPGTTLLLAAGTYDMAGIYLWIDTDGVTLRGATGDPTDVVLDAQYKGGEVVTVAASDVTIADLTIQRAWTHPIHVTGGADGDIDGTVIHNVHLLDPGQQALKINPTTSGHYADDGVVSCSVMRLSDEGRGHIRDSCYTGGIDAHGTRGWHIHDNLIEGFWCSDGLSEHGIHMWRGNRDTILERNVIVDSARGIGLGLVDCCNGEGRTFDDDPCPSAGDAYVDDWGGIVRNNVVWAGDDDLFASSSGFDSGISLAAACNATVVHNTVASTAAPTASSIEWRFDVTLADIAGNLMSHNLWDRGGTANLSDNLDKASLDLLVDPQGLDFHLADDANAAIDQGTSGWVTDDIDGEPRDTTPDLGADERP